MLCPTQIDFWFQLAWAYTSYTGDGNAGSEQQLPGPVAVPLGSFLISVPTAGPGTYQAFSFNIHFVLTL